VTEPSRSFLFSIDLEDIRTFVPGGERYAERVPTNVARYLEFLARHRVRCTFFTVGDVARWSRTDASWRSSGRATYAAIARRRCR
jgi:hypothetical protein